MQHQKSTPNRGQSAGAKFKNLVGNIKQENFAPIPSKSQAFVCGFCVYFRDVKKSFCHFTGEKVKFMDVACTYSMAVPHE